ncbi:rab GTPase-activating protein 22-like isoform X1 [Syzygium oleosum]|uniref:rab GTPase-activating protein 22-like isoform X1 n=1 Tax=Syzygium oleosum TaxID=219896 RepID=UPI0024B8B329|nr:rab GTPase-activating protein 22-like isoform X1 [Syzygium oleosum]
MVLGIRRLRGEITDDRLAGASPAALFLMLLFTTGFGGGNDGARILLAEGSGSSGGGGGGARSGSLVGGGGGGRFWSSAAAPSNVGTIAIAVTAMAGLALAATLVYSRRGSLKSPWSRRRRKHALLPKQWKSLFTPDGKLSDGGVKFLKKVRSGGIDPSIRAEVWPFLLGVYDINSSKEERDSLRSQNRKQYESLRKQCQQILSRSEKSLMSKESAGDSCNEGSGDFSQVLDSAMDDDVSSRRSPCVEGDGTGTYVDGTVSPMSDGVSQSSNLIAEGDTKSSPDQVIQSSHTILEGDSQKKNGDQVIQSFSATVKGHNNMEKNGDQVIQSSGMTIKGGSDKSGLQIPQSSTAISEGDLQNANRVPQCSHTIVEGDTEKDQGEVLQSSSSKVEGNMEKSGLMREGASAGDSDSTDSDSSEEIDSIPHFLPTEEVGVSDISELTEESSSVPATKTKTKIHSDEDFATWQRIIRLDALRANADWVIYSPSQATVSEMKARRFADSVGLKDYDHLEPSRIFHAARLVSILEAYALYDPEIGYCQGMSDLLSPIISVMEEDDEAFWCFVGFMKKARHNFRLDEVGIRRQLNIVSKIIKCKDSHLYSHLEKLQAEDCFFVYRMVVVLFRRELNFEQTLCLWEVMWADQAAVRAGIARSAWGRMRLRAPPTDDLLLYAIAACVLQRRKLIIEKYSSMEDIMRECNSMAGHLDVWKLLDDAHDLVVTLQDKLGASVS